MISDTKNLLFEIGVEELPAGFLFPALGQLRELAESGLKEKNLISGHISTMGTPRRLTLMVNDLATRQPDTREKITGPAARIAFDADGNPTKAGEGFARSKGIDVSELRIEKTGKGEYVVAERIIKGLDTVKILEDMLPRIITSLNFPKSMRWADHELRFARPIRWIVALFGKDIVRFGMAGVHSGAETRGHRFMATGAIKLEAQRDSYLKVLEEAFVLADPDVRQERLLEEARNAAASGGGRLLEDSDLVELNTNLTEFPSAVCGRFDTEFLELPESVLITCMKEHQKYFAIQDESAGLMPHFVAINNTRSPDPDLVTTGHERVLRARLSDAAFFYREDTKKRLEEFVRDLGGMVFHRKLGTLLDKTRRIQALAEYVAAEVSPPAMEAAKRAAWLCKADLLTEMVGEFPTLQGIIGREYARLSGEPEDVALAIAEHYMPVKSGAPIPASIPGAVVSIADKMDTICSTFAIGLRPTGTQDPYALRRLALGILHIMEESGGNGLSLSLSELVKQAVLVLAEQLPEVPAGLKEDILEFFRARFVNDLTGRGLDIDVVEAAVRAGFDMPRDCVERTYGLKAVRDRKEFEPISTAFKRVMNILKDYDGGIPINTDLFEEADEQALYQAYLHVKEKLTPVLSTDRENKGLSREHYEQALIILLSIKPQVDSFFDNVMVMVDNTKVRDNRLALLWHISRLFLRIGDLSAIAVGQQS